MTLIESHIDLDLKSNGTSPPAAPDVRDHNESVGRGHHIARAVGAGSALGIVIACLVLLYSTEIREIVFTMTRETRLTSIYDRRLPQLEAEARQSELRVNRSRARLRSLLPRTAYLVVSTSDNRFELYGPGGLVREGVCSTGSYVLLRGGNEQEWIFQTPRGSFRILEKRINPVWSKPDWAFVEEGLPIPPPGAPERYERGVLGKYALAIGSGYLIHGTLYQRMLGQPVTHGCIRLGDEDLEAVYRELAQGARIFIY